MRIKIFVVVLILFIVPIKVKAETIIEIKIPDEIKIKCKCGCKCGCCDKTESAEIQPQKARNTHVDDETALQKIALAEAGNTDVYTMAYVMQTVLNRVDSDDFPDTVQEVVEQKGQFTTYPVQYDKAIPNDLSKSALNIVKSLDNKNQLYFENTVPGSWQSTNLQFVFRYNSLSFYR